MSQPLPVEFDPQRLAKAGDEFIARLPLAHFKRLVAELRDSAGEVSATLRFVRAEGGRVRVSGRMRAEFTLRCERCLGDFALEVDEEFDLVVVDSDKATETLPEEMEPLVTDERGHLRAVDLLEDELLLALPIVAKHADEHDCVGNFVYKAQPIAPAPQAPRSNPFAALAGLKKND